MKQAQILVVMIVFICSYLLTPFQYLGQASAADGHITTEANKYVTDVKLYSQYEDGPQTQFDVFESVSVAYTWAVSDDETIASGDKMVFQLPKQLYVADGTTSFPVTVSDTDTTQIGVATVDRQTNQVTITFNDYFEKNPKSKAGTLAFWTNWNWQQQNVVTINDINNLDFGKAVIPIKVVNYGPDKDEKIGKYGWIDPDTGLIEWRVRINFAKENLQNVVYHDSFGAGQQLVGNVKVEYGYFEDDLHSTFKSINHAAAQVENTADGFKVTLGNLNGLSAYISYQTKPTGEMKSEYENTGRLTANGNTVATQTVWTPKSGGSATGSGNPIASFTVVKQWDDNNNAAGKRPESITVALYKNGQKTDQTVTLNDANDWVAMFTGLDKYDANGEPYYYSVKEVSVPAGYEQKVKDNIITNTYIDTTPKTTVVEGKKKWDDANDEAGNRPTSVDIQLLQNGQEYETTTATADNNWQYRFADLPVNDDEGKPYTYKVKEVNVPKGYTSTVNGFDITNKYTPETTTVAGTKTWVDADDEDGKRPESITVHLLANGQKVDKTTVTAKTNWQYSFKDLPKYEKGQAIQYSVSEEAVAGYTTTIDGYNITNTYTPAKTSFAVTKVWDDAKNQDGKRPESINVQLYNGDQKVGDEVTLSASNDWSYTWTALAEKVGGKQAVYTVKEVNVPAGYTSKVEGNTITNSYTPATTNVSGTKAWDDNNNQDGKRPEAITVMLFNGDQKVAEKTVTAQDNWAYSFDNLPKYKNGKVIDYTIKEEKVAGYKTEVKGFNLTNTYTPATTSVEGTKTWNDANDQDGMRPESINVNLLADGQKVDEKIVTAKDNWTYSFTNLPKYNNGQLIQYTIAEDAIDHYTTTIDGYDLTNSYTPGKTSFTVTKGWDDANDQDGMRPTSINVQLFAGNEKVGDEVTLSAKDNWTYTWTDLALKANGQQIAYTVKEVNVPKAYEVTTTEIGANNVQLTNSYTPATTSVEGTKTWVDANDQDGKRPANIVVELFDGKEKVAEQTVTAATNWHYAFTGLPKYEDGNIINYTVKEQPVAGYKTTIDGYNITNTYTPAMTSVEGTKTWNDANNQDGKRPEAITVNLLADGQKVAHKVVTAQDNWAYSFSNLPKYNAGKAIVYTVTEDAVANYATAINGYDITNSYTPGKTSFTVTKAWNDANDQDGKRPEAISVQLYANGQPTGGVVSVTAAQDWTYTWTNLAQKANGQDIVYTVKEVNVLAGYTATVIGNVITNTYTPETTAVDVVKVWDDIGNEAQRPEAITVNLFANGEKVGEATVTATTDWKHSFTNLPKYNAGKEIVYTITENAVPSYKTEVDGFTITNRYVKTVVEENPPNETPNTPEEPTTPEEKPETPEPTTPQKEYPVTPSTPVVTTPPVTTTMVNPPRQSGNVVTPTPSTTVVPASTTTYQAAPAVVSKQGLLPQTGDRTIVITYAGIALLIGALALLIVRKRRMN